MRAEIEDFLVHEAELLDTGRYGEWLDLLHEDFLYRVPVPLAREDPTQSPYDDVLEYANESKSFLEMRFRRIASDFAWAERPAAMVRHFVSNFRVEPEEGDVEAYRVRTNVLVVRARLPEVPVIATAGRHDRIVRQDGVLLLASRVVHLDAEVPTESQLGVIF
ncbi:aromatic-ring-hydroxylating dioxygenase subunit beta [Streptomyces sp. NPDC001312]|uniref:aromatic-ring-hydroxylating dioxygenase subunit beta n=1 Tax=Streptomyces sp. NPDC001312 TaxID=3364561 RepID=UPI00368A9818